VVIAVPFCERFGKRCAIVGDQLRKELSDILLQDRIDADTLPVLRDEKSALGRCAGCSDGGDSLKLCKGCRAVA